MEYARNVLGIDAEFEETSPQAAIPLISKLACSLAGLTQTVKILPGSHAAEAYGRAEVAEQFACRYGLNQRFQSELNWGPPVVSGVDDRGDARIVELTSHPFYMGTLFLPQMSSSPGKPHPLIVAFVRAAAAFRSRRSG